MSVSTFFSNFFSKQVMLVLLMSFSLLVTGCGAGSDASDSSAQVSDTETDSGDETNDAGNDDPVEDPVDETFVLNLLQQPQSATITDGESHTFTVVVEHDQPITVTWYRNGSAIQNSSSTSLSASVAGTYDCSVSDGTQSVGCNNFNLTVEEAPTVSITDQPSNQMVNEGVDVTLTVSATGNGSLSYQWYFDGAAISGATAASLTLGAVTTGDSGSYYVVVSNSDVTATSSTVSVNVAANELASALISWDRPQQRADSSELVAGEIQSYEIYYADSASAQMEQIDTVAASELDYVATGLDAGTHYFSLVTVDVNGLKSAQSSPVSVSIN